jgi:predicted nucleic acid-binding protein
MAKDKYVLDSSIWIEIHRNNQAVVSFVQPLIDRSEICLVDVINAEVLRGARSSKDFLRLKQIFADFPEIQTSWNAVAGLAFRMAQKGLHPPLIDLYIAQASWEQGKTLITQDKHFPQIAKIQPFPVVLL